MTAYIDAHVHPPVAEFLEGPMSSFLPGLKERRDFAMAPESPSRLIDSYRERDARAVLLGWDSESSRRRPFGSRDVAALVEAAPDLFWGLGAADPSKGAAAVAQVHEAARLGLAGIAAHPAAQGHGPGDRMTFPVWEAAEEHNLICLFHTGSTIFGAGMPGGGGLRLDPARPIHVDGVAARLPGLRIVMAHGGTLWLKEAIAVAAHKSNVYLCLGGQSPQTLSEEALEAVRGPLADRVIFGSGYPFADPDAWIEKWAKLGLSEDVTRKVLHDNALSLFGGGETA